MRAWSLVVVCGLIGTASAQPGARVPSSSPELEARDKTFMDQMRKGDTAGERITAEKALDVQRKLSGDDSIWTWRREQNLLGVLQSLDFRAALALEKTMLAKAERLHGKESTEVRDMLGSLCGTLEMLRDHDAADAAYQRLIALTKKIHGEKSGLYAFDLLRYATFLGSRSEYVMAARLQEQAIAILTAGGQDAGGQLTSLALSYMQFDQAKA